MKDDWGCQTYTLSIIITHGASLHGALKEAANLPKRMREKKEASTDNFSGEWCFLPFYNSFFTHSAVVVAYMDHKWSQPPLGDILDSTEPFFSDTDAEDNAG